MDKYKAYQYSNIKNTKKLQNLINQPRSNCDRFVKVKAK